MFVEIDEPLQAIVKKIMAAPPNLVDTTKGRSGADPSVIALAKTTNPQMCIVTEEYRGKERIPDVCDAQGLDHCGVADLVEREGWTS